MRVRPVSSSAPVPGHRESDEDSSLVIVGGLFHPRFFQLRVV